MTAYVRYGTIWIAATLSTGIGLWYTRANKALVAGVDAAHVLAMADERAQVAYLTGTNAPLSYVTGVTNGTNIVSAAGRVDHVMRWDVIYSNVLQRARGMSALDTYASEGTGIRIYWTEDDFSNGMDVAQSETYWTNTATFKWTGYQGTDHVWQASCTNRAGTVITTSTRRPAAGVNLMQGVAGTNLPVAAAMYDAVNDGTNPAAFFGGCNNWWTQNGFGTNLAALECEIVTGRIVRATNRSVTTNGLNQARGIMTNLWRTVAFIDPSLMSFTNGAYRARNAYTNIYDAIGNQTLPGMHDMAGVLAGIQTVTSGTCGWSNRVYFCDFRGSYNWFQYPGFPSHDTSEGNFLIGQYRYDGCRLPYPAEWACASGYVGRVRVYACGGSGIAPEVKRIGNINHYSAYTETNIATYAASVPQPASYDVFDYGLLASMSAHGNPTNALVWTGRDYDTYTMDMTKPETNRLALVCDVSDPTTRPVFTLGSLADQGPADSGIGWEHAEVPVSYGSGSYAWTWYSFVHEVDVWKFVVVVDWKWKFN